MDIQVQNGPAPAAASKSKFKDVYQVAQELKPQQWFRWHNAPKAYYNTKKVLKAIHPDLIVYKSLRGDVIIKNDAKSSEVAAPSTGNPAAAKPARVLQPVLSSEQREAIAERVRRAQKL